MQPVRHSSGCGGNGRDKHRRSSRAAGPVSGVALLWRRRRGRFRSSVRSSVIAFWGWLFCSAGAAGSANPPHKGRELAVLALTSRAPPGMPQRLRRSQPLAHDGAAEQRHRVKQRQRALAAGHGNKERCVTTRSFCPACRRRAQFMIDDSVVHSGNLFEVGLNGVDDLQRLGRRGLQAPKEAGVRPHRRPEGSRRGWQFTELGDAALRQLQTFPSGGCFPMPIRWCAQ